jgi:hypothetical protein
VIIFNEGNPDREDLIAGTLGDLVTIPVVGLSFADGLAIYNQLQVPGGEPVVVRVFTSTQNELRPTSNVLADSPTGNPERVVVVGAHLDSVTDGPGINDNGSGASTILEIAEEMAELGIRNRQQLRFAFWGGEESDLVGSTHYVDSLSDDELTTIVANLNFDMLGSPNYVRFVYDGDGGGDPDVAGPPDRPRSRTSSSGTSTARAWLPSRPRSTAAPTTARSSPSASRPAACSAAPRARRPTRRPPSTAAPPASPATPATTRPVTPPTTSAPRP